MSKNRWLGIALAIAVILGGITLARVSSTARADIADDDFKVQDTAQLLDLCTASPSDPHYTAAIHFCHGYLVGAFQFRREEHASGKQTLSCMPNPMMTRNQEIQSFISWAQAHREYATEPAADSFGRFLDMNAPCHG